MSILVKFWLIIKLLLCSNKISIRLEDLRSGFRNWEVGASSLWSWCSTWTCYPYLPRWEHTDFFSTVLSHGAKAVPSWRRFMMAGYAKWRSNLRTAGPQLTSRCSGQVGPQNGEPGPVKVDQKDRGGREGMGEGGWHLSESKEAPSIFYPANGTKLLLGLWRNEWNEKASCWKIWASLPSVEETRTSHFHQQSERRFCPLFLFYLN